MKEIISNFLERIPYNEITCRRIPENDLGEISEYNLTLNNLSMALSHHSKGYLEVLIFDKNSNTTLINQIVENDCYDSVDYLLRKVKSIWN